VTEDNICLNYPLHGASLKQVVSELVEHYGWEILYAYLKLNCFKNKPTIESSVKFLKKTDWAKDKVEGFYLYKLKNLPKADNEQFQLPPRERIILPEDKPRAPKELSLEDAEKVNYIKEQKNKAYAIKRKRSTPSNPWGV